MTIYSYINGAGDGSIMQLNHLSLCISECYGVIASWPIAVLTPYTFIITYIICHCPAESFGLLKKLLVNLYT